MSAIIKSNRLGRCALCEDPIYEADRVYPLEHAYAGEARILGKPLDNLRHVTLILVNGSTIRITMCDKCTEVHEELWISEVWERILNTWKLEMSDHHRELIGAKAVTPEQRETNKTNLKNLVHNVPIGVINVAEHGEYNG